MSLVHGGVSAALPVASSPPMYFSDNQISTAASSATLPVEGDEPDVLGKRNRDPDSSASDALQPSTLKRTARPHDVLFRVVVPSRHIGRVIGREGSRIQQIREETKAMIKIADPVANYEERVIIISSKDDESEISNAETALYSIARVILEENNDGVEALTLGMAHVAANTIRLLIAGSQAGCLIGISGQSIAEIRSSSGATVSILAQHQLPLCASAHESDRVVQVSGEVVEVMKALEKIGMKLRENPPKKVISVRSAHNFGMVSSDPSHVLPSSAEQVTYEMMIMEKLVGGLIGRNGYNISKIRNESGATIKVTGLKGESCQRQIHFGGTAEQVAVARMLVENYICSQLLHQSGLQQQL